MKQTLTTILISAAAVALVVSVGCDRPKTGNNSSNTKNTTGEKKEWTAQEIAADPQGYLIWSQQQVAKQIAQREAKLNALAERRGEFEKKQGNLTANLDLVQNLHEQLKRAYQRADDEDRWPMVVAGKNFERAKAQQLIDHTKKYVADREPLRDTYKQLFTRLDTMERTLKNDVEELNRLATKLEIDLEKVKLDQTSADLSTLRQRQAELKSMASTVTALSEDPMSLQPPGEPAGRVDLNEILK
jgi:chromosome segregation ATPase